MGAFFQEDYVKKRKKKAGAAEVATRSLGLRRVPDREERQRRRKTKSAASA